MIGLRPMCLMALCRVTPLPVEKQAALSANIMIEVTADVLDGARSRYAAARRKTAVTAVR